MHNDIFTTQERKNMRTNHSYQQILDVITKKHAYMNAKEIHMQLPKMNITTIYRNLKQLLEDKKITVITKNNEQFYELRHVNHMHTQCIQCGTTQCTKIPQDLLKTLEEKLKSSVENIALSVKCRECEKK